MRKGGRHRIVDWAKPDAAGEPPTRPKRRLSELSTALAGHWTFAPGLARAGIAILIVAAVFVAVFKSVDGIDGPTENVKLPTIVRTTRVAPESATVPAQRAPKAAAWWLPPIDFEQSFSQTDFGAPGELCRGLAELGYSRARWAESKLFEGEWECSSDLAGEGTGNRSFVVMRGGSEDDASRLMLRMSVADEGGREPLIEKAREAVRMFSAATGLILSPDALPLLNGWRAGGTWTSKGTFRIVAEAGKDTTRILTLAATPPLMRPAGDGCRETCRNWAASFGTKIVEARRVKSNLRAVQ